MNATEKKSRREHIAAALTIDGWLTEGEATTLYDLARQATGPIIEIGSWKGRSTSALAHGSMDGNNQTVYAVDSFIGVPTANRPTSNGHKPGLHSSSPEELRANLDQVGVNGLVKIVAKPSQEAAAELPDCDLLFIDGDHHYSAVLRDFDAYLPKVRPGGTVVIHDVHATDMDVVRAFDERVMTKPLEWRILRRVGSAIVMQRCEAVHRTVALACPGRGLCWGAVKGVLEASLGAHEVRALNNSNGFDDFNAMWAAALNLYEAGAITHFAMLHSDVAPTPGWLDILLDEMERLQADLVSVAIPIKDSRGLTSCGLGDLKDRWGAFRRLTMRELMDMPETFALGNTPHPDKVLLHNTGCWVCDLRNPLFFQTSADGELQCIFDFPTSVVRLPANEDGSPGQWINRRESEDWYFSRQLHLLKARTFITRKVRLSHIGEMNFPNDEAWGTFERGDEDTAPNWRKETKQ